MNPPKKLASQSQSQQQQTVSSQQQSQQPAVLEFANTEELLRHDVLHTPVPPQVGLRVQESIRQIPRPPAPWWRRWFGGAES